MIEIRCICGRLLAKAKFQEIAIKCPRCKTLNNMKAIEPQIKAPTSANVEVKNDKTNYPLDGR